MTNYRDIYLKQIAEVQLELQRQDGLVQQAKLDQIQLVAKRKQMIKEKQEKFEGLQDYHSKQLLSDSVHLSIFQMMKEDLRSQLIELHSELVTVQIKSDRCLKAVKQVKIIRD
jgi:hypothetical protein